MAKTVGVRTAAGGLLSLEITPADVIGRCRRQYREGDLYCEHLAALHGHPIAWLADQPELHVDPAAMVPAPTVRQRPGITCAPTFLDLGELSVTPA